MAPWERAARWGVGQWRGWLPVLGLQGSRSRSAAARMQVEIVWTIIRAR
jgi:hypothetical protein